MYYVMLSIMRGDIYPYYNKYWAKLICIYKHYHLMVESYSPKNIVLYYNNMVLKL